MTKVMRLRKWLRALPENPFVVCQRQSEHRRGLVRRLWSNYGLYFLLLTFPLLLAVSTARNLGVGQQVDSALRGAVVLLAFVQVVYVALRAIMQTAASVVIERQRGTLLSLALTQVNSADYADGITAASVRPVVREITVLFPLAALIGLLAGADVFSIVMLYAISVMTACIFGYLGVWISAGSTQVGQATNRAVSQTLFLLLVTPFLMVFGGFWAFPVWIVHPFVALSLAIWGTPAPAHDDFFSWIVVRWWSLLAIPVYMWIATSFRRRAIRALERTHLI
ncbi:MAG: hypothetical protein AB1758_02140 [Candidatus Eremiobacterota bacterium]